MMIVADTREREIERKRETRRGNAGLLSCFNVRLRDRYIAETLTVSIREGWSPKLSPTAAR